MVVVVFDLLCVGMVVAAVVSVVVVVAVVRGCYGGHEKIETPYCRCSFRYVVRVLLFHEKIVLPETDCRCGVENFEGMDFGSRLD